MLRNAASNVAWVGRSRTLAFCVLAVLVAASLGLLLTAKPAHANAFRVNTMEDAGDQNLGDGTCATEPFAVGTEPKCSLRAAIQETNSNGATDTIIFDPVLRGTITLTLGQLQINNDTPADDLSIQGPGARKVTVNANDQSRVLLMGKLTNVTVSGLTISDGSAGIAGTSGNVGKGGGIYNLGTLVLSNSTVSGNAASFGGGLQNDGTLTLRNSTVSGNIAAEDGGGIYNLGTLELSNSTVSANTAINGGGGIMDIFGTMVLRSSTVSGNNTTNGPAGGIYFTGQNTLSNTIIARNTASTNPDALGSVASEGNNLIGNTTGVTGLVPSDLRNVNPLLGPLQNNGGATNTHALLLGSPAVDTANNTACTVTDQRGARRDDGNNDGTRICDIGAFEVEVAPKVTTVAPSAGKIGVARNTNLTATFSEKMARTSITKTTFKLFKCLSTTSTSCTTQITNVTVSVSTDGLKATLNPFGTSSTLLLANTKYKAVVTTGAKDLAGNALDQNDNTSGNQQKVWFFTVSK